MLYCFYNLVLHIYLFVIVLLCYTLGGGRGREAKFSLKWDKWGLVGFELLNHQTNKKNYLLNFFKSICKGGQARTHFEAKLSLLFSLKWSFLGQRKKCSSMFYLNLSLLQCCILAWVGNWDVFCQKSHFKACSLSSDMAFSELKIDALHTL